MSEKKAQRAGTVHSPPAAPSNGRSRHFSTLLLCVLTFLVAYNLPKSEKNVLPTVHMHDHGHGYDDHHHHHHHHDIDGPETLYTEEDVAKATCPVQPPTMAKGKHWDPTKDTEFAELAAKRLTKAIQFDTVSFDNMPMNASESVFDKHYDFAKWLESEYSKLFKAPMKHEYINTHGHLFTWEGSNPDLKPIILMAHTDTVPVLPATLDQWTYPPFEGRVVENALEDTPGRWVFGRGASDCKNQLLGVYNAVERLITEGFKPERTILIANGFDEEIGGARGALPISEVLEKRYGPNSVAFVVDEGFSGVAEQYGKTFASLGMAEKGSVNMIIKVENPGGHSSVPPEHTGIGVVAMLLTALETHPFKPELHPDGPLIKYLSCLVEHAPDCPKTLKEGIQDPKRWNQLAHDLAKQDRTFNSYLATTQAIDIIGGGVKINALPEYVEARVNYRISFTSSVHDTVTRLAKIITPIAEQLGYTISPFDGSAKASSKHITLMKDDRGGLEPAPITSPNDPSFKIMAGTTKAVFGDDIIVAPTGMYANTDTRTMWKLTDNLYRFTPAVVTKNFNVHTVDEKMPLDGHLTTTGFFYQLIQNTEGWIEE